MVLFITICLHTHTHTHTHAHAFTQNINDTCKILQAKSGRPMHVAKFGI